MKQSRTEHKSMEQLRLKDNVKALIHLLLQVMVM